MIVPGIVTSPVARSVTGVFFEFRAKVIATPNGILIVVKLNTPLSGTWMVWLVVGANAPSAPVDPLLKVLSCARGAAVIQPMHRAKLSSARVTRIKVNLEHIAFVLLSVERFDSRRSNATRRLHLY
jgi:hypothetical protein